MNSFSFVYFFSSALYFKYLGHKIKLSLLVKHILQKANIRVITIIINVMVIIQYVYVQSVIEWRAYDDGDDGIRKASAPNGMHDRQFCILSLCFWIICKIREGHTDSTQPTSQFRHSNFRTKIKGQHWNFFLVQIFAEQNGIHKMKMWGEKDI